MDLVWSNDLASASFLETLRTCPNLKEMGVPELLSGVAAGWKSKLIVEPWSWNDSIEESVGLTIAARHTGGRHVCIVPYESYKKFYLKKLQDMEINFQPELVVAEAAETVMPQFEDIDFLVVDCNNINVNFPSLLRAAKLRPQGAVIVPRNLDREDFIDPNFHIRIQFELRVQQEAGVLIERLVLGDFFDILYVRRMADHAPPPPQPPSQPQQPQPQPQPQSHPPPHSPMLRFHITDPRNRREHNFPV